METLYAIDLTQNPTWHKLWQAYKTIPEEELPKLGLPQAGFLSPMGFYLFHQPGKIKPTYQITFNLQKSLEPTYLKFSKGRNILRQTIEKTDAYNEFRVEINENQANITIDEATWNIAKDALILVITQCWRNYVIEQEVFKISQYTYDDLKRTSRIRIRDWRHEKRYLQHDLALRNLFNDMPYFEGPTLDPYYYHSENLTTEIYEKLISSLHIESWTEHLIKHIEASKDNYEAITEKFFHFKSYFWTIVLEVIIVIILLIDLLFIFRGA
jgi:hypothetical protein